MNAWFHSAGSSAELVSIIRFIDAQIFATHSAAYGMTLQLQGMDPECLSDEELNTVSARLLQALRLLPEDCSLHQMLVRRRDCELEATRLRACRTSSAAESISPRAS